VYDDRHTFPLTEGTERRF